MSVVADHKLDCVGLFCPMPILKTRDALKGMAVGQTLEMLSDDPASEADMKSCHELVAVQKNASVFRFIVRKTR
jgi:TusA-related sulfurtransferase